MANGRSQIMMVILAACLLGGCSSGPTAVPYAREYPAAIKQAETLDIQVFRRTTHIEFTNTTARAFGPCTLWLNRRFNRPIDGLAVGQTMDIKLDDFRDEYSAAFRGGGFFSTEAPDKLVQAQLEITDAEGKGVLVGLVVVGGN